MVLVWVQVLEEMAGKRFKGWRGLILFERIVGLCLLCVAFERCMIRLCANCAFSGT